MPTVTEADVAGMPRVADATLAATFHWARSEEERLYRDCPSAFWLAPDGDGALPPTDGPVAAAPFPGLATRPTATATGRGAAIGFGVCVAGPVFLAGLSTVMEGSGPPITRVGSGLLIAFASAPLSVPFGAVAAALPVMLGVALLTLLGERHAVARWRSVWAATGAAMGLAIAGLFDAGIVTVALVLASIACATAAHGAISWIDDDPA